MNRLLVTKCSIPFVSTYYVDQLLLDEIKQAAQEIKTGPQTRLFGVNIVLSKHLPDYMMMCGGKLFDFAPERRWWTVNPT